MSLPIRGMHRERVKIEFAVKIANMKLKMSSDSFLALLSYQAAPLKNGFSPSELLFSCRLRTMVLTHPAPLSPQVLDCGKIWKAEEHSRDRTTMDFDKR